MLFYFPVVIWRGMNNRTGVDMNDVIETAEKVRDAQDLEAKEKVTEYINMVHFLLDDWQQ